MDDQFPKMVYCWPAQSRDAASLQDGFYDVRTVDGNDSLQAALADGWFETSTDARGAGEAAAKVLADEAKAAAEQKKLEEAKALVAAAEAEGAPPTRAELEAKAKELGIEFNPRLGDTKLAALIDAKLAE